MKKPIARVLDLVDPASQRIWNMDVDDARRRVLSADADAVLGIEGSFALIARDGERVCLARSLDRPLRYFLAKEKQGPMLVVAERISDIRECLEAQGYGDQFHPTYTRMVPAHHVTRLALVGCPDPNPIYERFFDPPRGTLPADLDAIGEAYVGALYKEVQAWLATIDAKEPLGVLFSGGADSGAVLLALYHALLAAGQSPSRLKAFTLAVAGGGADLEQAREFLRAVELEMLGEAVEVPADAVDPLAAVELIEDYKPRDVECAAVGMALLGELRRRYPEWRFNRRRRRRRRELEGLSDRGEPGADHRQRGQQPHALPGRLGRRGDQALLDLQRRPESRHGAHLRAGQPLRLCRFLALHLPGGDRRGGSDPVRRLEPRLPRESLRAQGRGHPAGRQARARC